MDSAASIEEQLKAARECVASWDSLETAIVSLLDAVKNVDKENHKQFVTVSAIVVAAALLQKRPFSQDDKFLEWAR